jgi:biotin operon repressor
MAIEAKAFEWSEPKMQRGITLAILVDVMGKICVSRERLGMMLSLSRQTVNELLRHLEQESIIHCQRGGVRILDSSRLRDAAPGFLVRRGSIASYN